MKQSKLLGIFVEYILGVSAIFAEKIKYINETEGINIELIIAIIYNTIFSIFFSTISSFFITLILYPYTETFSFIWYILFKIMIVFSIFMVLLNILSKKLNIPMIFIQIILFLKYKYKTIGYFLFFIIASYALLAATSYILFHIFFEVFNKYNFNVDTAFIYSIIIAVSLTIAGFYAFPTNKNDRDINELLVSPFFILTNIWIGFTISRNNIIINAEKGDEKMVSNLILLFFITACLQIISYFKKLFEKIHDLPMYEEDIRNYSKKARTKITLIYNHLRETILEIKQFYKEIKIIKKDKYFYIKFFCTIILAPVFIIGFNNFVNLITYQLNSYQLDDYLTKIISYMVLIIVFLFLLSKLFTYLFLLFKGKNLLNRSEKWETASLILFILGILISMSEIILFKQLFHENILFIGTICLFISGIIFITNTFINWLFSKTKRKNT